MFKKENNFNLEVSSPPHLQQLRCSSDTIDTMLESFYIGNEKEQRRVRNRIKQEETVGEKKIALERKHRDIQMKELSTEQRLVKTRYINMVRRTKASQISMNQGKK